MATGVLNALTRVVCNQSAFTILPASAATGLAGDGLCRTAFLLSEPLPLRSTFRTPRHERTQCTTIHPVLPVTCPNCSILAEKTTTPQPLCHAEPFPNVGQLLQYPAVGRTSGKALRVEEKFFTEPLEFSEELAEISIIQELVLRIKEDLSCIRHSDGEISFSAYDTAWVARIPEAKGSGEPHFPGTLEWIVANQHPDESSGDDKKDWLYNRFIQTLACIVALKFWNRSSSCVQRGEEYLTKYADRLEKEEILSMPIGFELCSRECAY